MGWWGLDENDHIPKVDFNNSKISPEIRVADFVSIFDRHLDRDILNSLLKEGFSSYVYACNFARIMCIQLGCCYFDPICTCYSNSFANEKKPKLPRRKAKLLCSFRNGFSRAVY